MQSLKRAFFRVMPPFPKGKLDRITYVITCFTTPYGAYLGLGQGWKKTRAIGRDGKPKVGLLGASFVTAVHAGFGAGAGFIYGFMWPFSFMITYVVIVDNI